MDRVSLDLLLSQGLSLAEIGRRFDRHEATVAYWVGKHGLEAANRDKHAPRGALQKDDLTQLVGEGASIAAIADRLGCAQGTVKHWLRRYGLRTSGQRTDGPSTNAAKSAGNVYIQRTCRHHGLTDFWLEGRGYYRCQRCRWEAVSRRRRKVKQILVQEAGGRCRLCGYDRYVGALHFHHIDPADKGFELSQQGVTRSLARARVEARKCVLLCSNCHAEVEAGITLLMGPAAVGEVT
jgi:transposase